MNVKLLTEHNLEFLILKGGCPVSSDSTLVKIPHCWKSHVAAQLCCGYTKHMFLCLHTKLRFLWYSRTYKEFILSWFHECEIQQLTYKLNTLFNSEWKEFNHGPKVIKLFSCSTQLSTKFILLISVKMPTIVGILTFISTINTTYERLKARNFFTFRCFGFYDELKFRAQLSWAWKKFYNLEALIQSTKWNFIV